MDWRSDWSWPNAEEEYEFKLNFILITYPEGYWIIVQYTMISLQKRMKIAM
jgi:hypothetical protein